MSEDLQAQIDELKDRISSLELLLAIAAEIISDIDSQSMTSKEYKNFVDECLPPEKRTKRLNISSEIYPNLALYIATKKAEREANQ